MHGRVTARASFGWERLIVKMPLKTTEAAAMPRIASDLRELRSMTALTWSWLWGMREAMRRVAVGTRRMTAVCTAIVRRYGVATRARLREWRVGSAGMRRVTARAGMALHARVRGRDRGVAATTGRVPNGLLARCRRGAGACVSCRKRLALVRERAHGVRRMAVGADAVLGHACFRDHVLPCVAGATVRDLVACESVWDVTARARVVPLEQRVCFVVAIAAAFGGDDLAIVRAMT